MAISSRFHLSLCRLCARTKTVSTKTTSLTLFYIQTNPFNMTTHINNVMILGVCTTLMQSLIDN